MLMYAHVSAHTHETTTLPQKKPSRYAHESEILRLFWLESVWLEGESARNPPTLTRDCENTFEHSNNHRPHILQAPATPTNRPSQGEQMAKIRPNAEPDGSTRTSAGGTNTKPRTSRKIAAEGGHPRGWVNPNPAEPRYDETRDVWVNKSNQPICGSPRSGKSTSGPGICCNPAGMRTEHPGIGPCHLHWGSAPTVIQHYMVEEIIRNSPTYGTPQEIGPHEAILQEVHRTAGHVQWLYQQIQLIGDNKARDALELHGPGRQPGRQIRAQQGKVLHQYTHMGIMASSWLNLYQTERKHLVTVCKAAVDMGVAERQVQVAEEQGRLLALVLQKFILDDELALTPLQRSVAPAIARKYLTAIEATASELPALPEKATIPN